jgi:hypothetical protein
MRVRSQPLQLAAVLAAALAAIATSPAWEVDYPAWQVEEDRDTRAEALAMRAWVSKSGLDGMGVTVRVRNNGSSKVRLSIEKAELYYGYSTIPAKTLPGETALLPRETRHFYVPFLFENRALKDGSGARGRLEITFTAGDGAKRVWILSVTHEIRKYDIRARLARVPIAGDAEPAGGDAGVAEDGGPAPEGSGQ